MHKWGRRENFLIVELRLRNLEESNKYRSSNGTQKSTFGNIVIITES